jgi:hypothetical protein
VRTDRRLSFPSCASAVARAVKAWDDARPGAILRSGGTHGVSGIKPGEAAVMRNVGGRITPGLLEPLGLLGRIGEVAGAIPGGGGDFHLRRTNGQRWHLNV